MEEALAILKSVFGDQFGVEDLPVLDEIFEEEALLEKVKSPKAGRKSKSGKARIVNKTMYLKF